MTGAPRLNQRIGLFLPSLRGGGAERVAVTLANGFAARGHQVDLVLSEFSGQYGSEVDAAVRVVNLHASRVATSIPGLVRYLRRAKPVALLSMMNHANVAAVLAHQLSGVGTRLVVSERNTLSSAGAASRLRWLMPMLMKLAYPRADCITAVSKGVADDLARVLGLPLDCIHILYNPVVSGSLLERSMAPVDHDWLVDPVSPVILSAGRLGPQKDYPTLLRAFAEVRKKRRLRLILLGEGPARDELARLAVRLGVQDDVLLPGFVANPFSWMRHSRLFVLSSRWEGLPSVLIQAMACGTRVVSTDCPSGPSEILEEGKWGRLVPVGNDQAMAEAMIATLDDPNPPDVAARASAFDAERSIDRHLEVLLR